MLGRGSVGGNLHTPIPNSGNGSKELQQDHYETIVLKAPGNAAGRGFIVDPSALAGNKTHTQYPIVTGSSVLGLKFCDGVIIAADMLGSYGSTKRFKGFERLYKVNRKVVVGASGDLSDFQYIQVLLDALRREDTCAQDGHMVGPTEVLAYLQAVLYQRRNKFDPLWNSLVVAGVEDNGKKVLGHVNMIGVVYEDSHVATGMGGMLAKPLFRNGQRDDMARAQAEALLHSGLCQCYYRDKQMINKFRAAVVTAEGVTISDPFAVETVWDHNVFINPSRLSVNSW